MQHSRRELLSATACILLSSKIPSLAQTNTLNALGSGNDFFRGDPNARFEFIDTSGGIVFPTLPFSYASRDNDSKPRTSSQIPAFIQVSASAITAKGRIVSPGGVTVTGPELRPYERLEYSWDFGDPAGKEIFQNYSIYPFTGVPVNANNQQWGPEACYVYRKPGTYTITLNIRGRNPTGTDYITKSVTRQFTALANSRTNGFDTDAPGFTGRLATNTQSIVISDSLVNVTVGTTLSLVDATGRMVNGYLAPGTYVNEMSLGNLHVRTDASVLAGAILQGLSPEQMQKNNWLLIPSNDFYFDSVCGDDANGGNTPSTPKKGYDEKGNITLSSQIKRIFADVRANAHFHFAYGSSWSSATTLISNGDQAITGIRFSAYHNPKAAIAENNPTFILDGNPSGSAVSDARMYKNGSPSLIKVSDVAGEVALRNQNSFSVKPSPNQGLGDNEGGATVTSAPVSIKGARNGHVGDVVFSNMDFILDKGQPKAAGASCFWLARGQTQVMSDLYLDRCNFQNNGQGRTAALGLFVNNPGSYDSRSMGQNFVVWGGKVTSAVYATYTDFIAHGTGNTLIVTQIKSYRGDPANGNVPFNIAKAISPTASGAQAILDHGPLPIGASFAPGTAIVPPITKNGDGTWSVTLSHQMTGSIPDSAPVNVLSTYGGSAVIAFGAMQWQTFLGTQVQDNGGLGVQFCHTMNLEAAGKHLLVRWIQTRAGPGWNNTIRNSTGAYNIGGISSAFPQPDLTGGYNLIADCDIQSTPYRWTDLAGKGQQVIGTGFGGFGNELSTDPKPFTIDASQQFFASQANCSPPATSACQIKLNAQTAPGHKCQQLEPGVAQVAPQMSVYDRNRGAEVGVTLNGRVCSIIDDQAVVSLGSSTNAGMLGPPLISSAGTSDTLEFTSGGMANCVFERNNVANIKGFAVGVAANNMTVRDCNVWNFGRYGLYFMYQDYQATCAYRNRFYRPLLPKNFGNPLYDNRNPIIWFYFGKPITNSLSQEFTHNIIWDDRGASGSSNGPSLMRLDWNSAAAISGGGGIFDLNQWYFPHPPANGNVMQSDSTGAMQTFAAYQTFGGSPVGSTPYFGPHDTELGAPPWSDPGKGNFGF
jgi:hypothetical protein